jgi:site-specific DNA-methyltransferase (adenine-specific)
MLEVNKIHHGDCFNLLKEIPDKSIDAIITDLPYGTTAAPFDKEDIDLEKLWVEYKRIIKPTRAIVLFAQQPFTTRLISSNIEQWKYNWVWEKDNATNFLNSHFQPMKITEDICVFGDAATSFTKDGESLFYNPQFTEGKPYTCKSGNQREDRACIRGDYTDVVGHTTVSDGRRYPKNLIYFIRDKERFHPTQKPISLLEYLVKTYTNEGDVVLDSCSGSGGLAIACYNTKRNFICIEKDENYYKDSIERLKRAMLKRRLF